VNGPTHKLLDNASIQQSANPRQTAHSDWWKRVPACLTSPLLRWHGPLPSGTDDPAWPEYQRVCVESDVRVRAELAAYFKVTAAPGSSAYDRAMLISLLGLFPAYSAHRETRGAKQKPDTDVDVESIARRRRHRSRKADE
jgi:hypothetical protein